MQQLKDISATEERVLRFYTQYIAEHGIAPMLKEVGSVLKMHPSTVSSHVSSLIEHGYFTRRPGNRNVILTEKAAV